MRYALSEKNADKLEALLAKTDPAMERRPSRGGTQGRRPVLVRCTDGTAIGGSDVGDQAYPAVIIDPDATLDAQPELPGGVWLTLLTDGNTVEAPTEDAVYFGEFTGDFDPDPGGAGTDDRPRVFAVAPAAGGSGSGDNTVYAGAASITSDDTWTDTAFDISLPAAGKYFLSARFAVFMNCSALGGLPWVRGRFWDETAGAVVPESYAFLAQCPTTGFNHYFQATMTAYYEVSAASVIRIEALRNGSGPTWTFAAIHMAPAFPATADHNGTFTYVKIG